MLIKIQGLPIKTKYHDVKLLIRSECTISEYKLDDLSVDSDRCKKVLVTARNEAEGFCLIKCLNGYPISSECCLRVEPAAVPKSNTMDAQHQNSFEQRPGSNYTNQTRNVYPNQMSGEYNRGPQNYQQSVTHMPSQRPVEQPTGRPDVWSSGNAPGEWSHNQPANTQGPTNSGFPGTPIYPQHPSIPQRGENTSYSDSRPQQGSNYGYPPKSNMPDTGHQAYRSHDLRTTEVPDPSLSHVPSSASRYQPSFQQEKPITIMKDNFQGPTMYQIGSGNPESYQGPPGHGGNPAWNQGQQPKHQAYTKANTAQYEKFYDDDRRLVHSGKRPDVKPPQEAARMPYKEYEKSGRQYSPSRRIQGPDHAISTAMSAKKRVSSPVGHGPPSREAMSRRLVSPERKMPPMGMAGRRPSPNKPMSPTGRRGSPSGRWVPPARLALSPGRRISPSARRYSPSRRVSPSGRRVEMARRMSPPGRRVISPGARVSPGRRMSPSGRRPPGAERRVSPAPGRRMSPQHKHVSPPGRRMSPSGRRISPNSRHVLDRRVSPRRMAMQKRCSPSRRLESPPPGTNPRQAPRYSPRRQHDKMADSKMEIDPSKSKQVRPAYESQASSQNIYSGGYRPKPKENVPYGMSSVRQPEQRVSPWQQERDQNAYPAMKKQEEDRREVIEKRHMPRQSRSPIPRDRSPVRDRYRTNSPMSHSPRRSWALEKRPYGRSPEIREAPPPPIWPGKNPRDDDPYKNKYNRVDEPPKQPHVWDRVPMSREEKKRIDDVRRPLEDKRTAGVLPREMAPSNAYIHTGRETKFDPREYGDGRKEDYQRQRDMARRPTPQDSRKDYHRQQEVVRRHSPERRDFREAHHSGHLEGRRHEEYRRQPSPRREETKKSEFHKDFDKDFEDIYKRTQEFKKKAEQMRRSGDRRNTHSEERHHEMPKEDKYDRRRERTPPPPRRDMDRLQSESERRCYEDQRAKEKKPDWKPQEAMRKKPSLLSEVKIKRDKAADEIMKKLLSKYKQQFLDLTSDQKRRVNEELKLALHRLFMDMFGEEDVSFIEVVIKYQTKISNKAEEAMVRDVLQCLPSQFRSYKRPGAEPDVPAKMARYSPEASMKDDDADDKDSDDYVPDWTLNEIDTTCYDAQSKTTEVVKTVLPPPQLVVPQLAAPSAAATIQTNIVPAGAPQSFVAPQISIPQTMMPLAVPPTASVMQYVPPFAPSQFNNKFSDSTNPDANGKLFLCRDDFQPITNVHAQILRHFLVSKIVQVTEASAGWAPDLTLKGLNTVHRFELYANDVASKEWLMKLDFSEFKYFTVLVYTAEELWYERAAIYLPGHSRYLSIEPLDKLILQNQHLHDVNIGKWKFVKKVPTVNGTRLYVDMPPSSAKALEKHKMILSYELQRVYIILKAVAVDKMAFDAGLRDVSFVDATTISNAPVPSLSYEPGVVQLTVKGNKSMSIENARQLKEIIIFHLFEYLKAGGTNKTDFVKYGICPPSSFGILPENLESRKWLMSTQFGKLNNQQIIIVGGDDSLVKYIDTYMFMPVEVTLNPMLAVERLRKSNQGVKGINYHLWKPRVRQNNTNRKRPVLEVDMDIESIETLQKLNFSLDYVDGNNVLKTVYVCSKYSPRALQKLIDKFKAEAKDSYDVSNMDLGSSSDDNCSFVSME